MSDKKTMDWKEPETQRKLALSILAAHDSTTYPAVMVAKVAEFMGCSAKAVTHQLPKLRSEIESLRKGNWVSTPGANGNGSAAASTTTDNKPSAKKRVAKPKADEADSGVEEGGSPTKKPKTPTKPRGKKAVATKDKDKEKEVNSGSDGDTADNGNANEDENETTEAAANLTIATPKAKSKAKAKTPAKKATAAKKAAPGKKEGAAKNDDEDKSDGEDVNMGDAQGDGEGPSTDDEIAKRKDAADGVGAEVA